MLMISWVLVASVGCANTAVFSVELPKQSPDAARNATGATFAWGPFRPLAFLGLHTPHRMAVCILQELGRPTQVE